MRSDSAFLVLDSVWLTSSSCFRTSVSWAMSRSVTLIDCCCDMEVRSRRRQSLCHGHYWQSRLGNDALMMSDFVQFITESIFVSSSMGHRLHSLKDLLCLKSRRSIPRHDIHASFLGLHYTHFEGGRQGFGSSTSISQFLSIYRLTLLSWPDLSKDHTYQCQTFAILAITPGPSVTTTRIIERLHELYGYCAVRL